MKFNTLHNNRKNFLDRNKSEDHVVVTGNNKILISAPHGVSQVRLGKFKMSEIGALSTALYLQKETNSYLIAKTQNNNDDANFDESCPYKSTIAGLIRNKDIQYIIDIHGLSSKRECDVNLGTHLGNNIKTNKKIFDSLHRTLIKNGFITTIDQPFMAGSKTISGSMASKFPQVWTLQIEINCNITNKARNQCNRICNIKKQIPRK